MIWGLTTRLIWGLNCVLIRGLTKYLSLGGLKRYQKAGLRPLRRVLGSYKTRLNKTPLRPPPPFLIVVLELSCLVIWGPPNRLIWGLNFLLIRGLTKYLSFGGLIRPLIRRGV